MRIIPLALAALAVAWHPAFASGYRVESTLGAPQPTYVQTGLIAVDKVLYGTSNEGGVNNLGTVFAVAPSGLNVLHSFAADGVDGIYPSGELLDVDGLFYGTAFGGGSSGNGVVFTIDPATGAERVVYNFAGGGDGSGPSSALIRVGQSLFGVTELGGNGFGTVFELDLSTGAERVVHRFHQGLDGQGPSNALLAYGTALYGTTEKGGGNGNNGVIYKIDRTSGAESVVHVFDRRTDGAYPECALVALNGLLYGTTPIGGAHSAGTAFSFDPASGSFAVLHTFHTEAGDVGYAYAGLLASNGVLYGVGVGSGEGLGMGGVFSMDPVSGAEQVLHEFAGAPTDGYYPVAALITAGGLLYGTTFQGGAVDLGTVFSLPP